MSSICEVVVAMSRWSKVFLASPYLDGVQFDVSEGHVTVAAVKFVATLGNALTDIPLEVTRCNLYH